STGAVRIIFFIFILQHQGLADLLEDDCGSTVAVGLRIVGGQNAFFNAYPWMALIKTSKKFFCAGTLVNNRCIVRLGEYDQSTDVDCRGSYCLPPFEEYYVEKVYLYSKFNFVDHGKDIGLLRLERQVAYKVHIQPICIILDAQRKAETDLIPEYMASGWGKTEKNVMRKVLKEVTIQRSDPQWCRNQFWKQLESSQICGTSNAGDTCHGDSGGPLGRLIRFGDVWRFVQFGIVSYGASKCFGIGVYTDVMSYVDWIRKTVLERDIEVVLPRMDLLDGGCFSNSTSSSSTPYSWLARIYVGTFRLAYGTLISDSCIVRLGEYDQSTDVDCRGSYCLPPFEEYYVEKVYLYSKFNFVDHGKDIGLLRLERQVAYKVHIQPICIILDAQRKAETDLIPEYIATGWGKTEKNVVNKVLKEVTIQRSDPQWCRNHFWKQLNSSQICGTSNAGDTCDADSGAPLGRLIRFGNVWRFVQFGVASYSLPDCSGIGVYTDVMSYVDWIRGSVRE
ncbi:hypothetical protein KR009_007560, partial [Drosophila setifemur]